MSPVGVAAPFPFSIREAIRSVLDETDLVDPEKIATKVAHEVPDTHVRPVLAEVLRDTVRLEIGRVRRVAEQRQRGLYAEPSKYALQKRRAAERIHALYAWNGPAWLRGRVSIGNDWKMVGDCRRDDCLLIAQERRENAQRNLAAAELWETRANLLDSHKVERLVDLPPDVLESAEGRDS